MRASVDCEAAAVTRHSMVPVWLMVPAKTGSPGPLSTGRLSPVTGAWSTAVLPSVTMASIATRSPGLTRTAAPTGTLPTGADFQVPSGCRRSAVSGDSASRPLIALRARSTARASINSAMAYSAMTIAASGHWPMTKAPATATDISALMFSRPCRRADRPLRNVPKPASPMAAAATARPTHLDQVPSGARKDRASAAVARASAASRRGRPDPVAAS